MKLVHFTNYTGKCIDTREVDDEVPFAGIWAQTMNDNEPCCCRNFGPREVQVVNSDFEKADPHDWSVYYVSGGDGRSRITTSTSLLSFSRAQMVTASVTAPLAGGNSWFNLAKHSP
jgi:hypothetical protein